MDGKAGVQKYEDFCMISWWRGRGRSLAAGSESRLGALHGRHPQNRLHVFGNQNEMLSLWALESHS